MALGLSMGLTIGRLGMEVVPFAKRESISIPHHRPALTVHKSKPAWPARYLAAPPARLEPVDLGRVAEIAHLVYGLCRVPIGLSMGRWLILVTALPRTPLKKRRFLC